MKIGVIQLGSSELPRYARLSLTTLKLKICGVWRSYLGWSVVRITQFRKVPRIIIRGADKTNPITSLHSPKVY